MSFADYIQLRRGGEEAQAAALGMSRDEFAQERYETRAADLGWGRYRN